MFSEEVWEFTLYTEIGLKQSHSSVFSHRAGTHFPQSTQVMVVHAAGYFLKKNQQKALYFRINVASQIYILMPLEVQTQLAVLLTDAGVKERALGV